MMEYAVVRRKAHATTIGAEEYRFGQENVFRPHSVASMPHRPCRLRVGPNASGAADCGPPRKTGDKTSAPRRLVNVMSKSLDGDTPPSGRASTSEAGRLRELFRELAEGRVAALEELYELLSDDLYGLALWRSGSPSDAADALQDTFVRLAQLGSRLKEVKNPRSYLLRMVHAAAVDTHRRRRRRSEEPLADVDYLAPERDADLRLDGHRISQLLSELPPEQREVIYLHHFLGESFAEVGRATGVPTFTAASRHRLGLKRLRRLLGVDS